jgi:hypothetical protein
MEWIKFIQLGVQWRNVLSTIFTHCSHKEKVSDSKLPKDCNAQNTTLLQLAE